MRSGGIFDLPGLTRRSAELDQLSSDESLWQNSERAQAVLRERSALQRKLDAFWVEALPMNTVSRNE